jgi:2-polyprenyl-3-methyl-5-hydroxy-6-metoxy-1,4-benzoquinol methylase
LPFERYDSAVSQSFQMTVTLEHPEGRVSVAETEDGRKLVSVELCDPSSFMPYSSAETDYSIELIEQILAFRGPARLCYSILRAEDPSHLAEPLRRYILGYLDERHFEGKRLLDFGCGSGSSTVALASLFPGAEIIAVDLVEGNIPVARARARHYGVTNATFLISPGPTRLPPDMGTFDFVFFSAVYEHLLPGERRVLMPKLWRLLRSDGVLFINQTPHRYYPVEYHTTGLPFLNYLPYPLAFWVAKRLSKRVVSSSSWDELLRDGVRGGTQREILKDLRAAREGKPQLLEVNRLGFNDPIDVWYSLSMERRPLKIKPVMRLMFKAISRVTKSSFLPDLNLAIRKTDF